MRNLNPNPQKIWQYKNTPCVVSFNGLQHFESKVVLKEVLNALQKLENQKALNVNTGEVVGWLLQRDVFGFPPLKAGLKV